MVNSVGMFQRLATLDLGIIFLSEEIAAKDVAAGRLIVTRMPSSEPAENVVMMVCPFQSVNPVARRSS